VGYNERSSGVIDDARVSGKAIVHTPFLAIHWAAPLPEPTARVTIAADPNVPFHLTAP